MPKCFDKHRKLRQAPPMKAKESHSPNTSLFILFLILLTFSSSFGQTYFFGILQPFIRADYGLSEAAFGRLYLLVTLTSAFGVTLIGPQIDRIPLERYTILLGVGLVIAVSLFSLFSPLICVIVGMMLARLIGQGLLVHAAMTTASRYFTRLRGRAIAFATGGITLGQAVFPPLMIALIERYDWRTASMIGLAGFVVFILPLLRYCLKDHKIRHAQWEARQRKLERHEADVPSDKKPGPITSLRRHDMIRDWRFYAVIPALTLGPFWTTALFFFADQLAALRDLTLAALTKTYALYAAVGFAAPLIGGSLVDRRSAINLLWLSPVAMILTLFLLLQTVAPMGAVMALLGIAVWIAVPINNALWAELYGTRYLGEIKGLANAVLVVSTALAPFLIGELIAQCYTFSELLIAGYAHSLVALVAIVTLFLRNKRT